MWSNEKGICPNQFQSEKKLCTCPEKWIVEKLFVYSEVQEQKQFYQVGKNAVERFWLIYL